MMVNGNVESNAVCTGGLVGVTLWTIDRRQRRQVDVSLITANEEPIILQKLSL